MEADVGRSDAGVSDVLSLICQGYDERSWHGPHLKYAIRRVSAEEASVRLRSGGRCIAEIAVHCAYWKYAARRRLTGEKRGSFSMKGSNWFKLPLPASQESWAAYRRILDEEQEKLIATVKGLRGRELDRVPEGSRVSHRDVLRGIAMHDVYHAGQIQLIKAMIRKT